MVKLKAAAPLFKRVLKELDISSSEIHHIGDNYVADYIPCLSQGLSVGHYYSPKERLREIYLSLSHCNQSLDSSMHLATMANRIIAARDGDKQDGDKQERDETDNYWWKLGFVYGGYITFAYCRWM